MMLLALAAIAAQANMPPHPHPHAPRDPAMRQARMERMFDMADTNHDGQVSRAEFTAARDRMRERRMERRERRGVPVR